MALPIEYHPAAEMDLEAAVDYYAGRVPELGGAFHALIKRAEALLVQHPEAGTALQAGVRRWVVGRFPYALLYTVDQ